jgi:hypothetical protein
MLCPVEKFFKQMDLIIWRILVHDLAFEFIPVVEDFALPDLVLVYMYC